LRDAIERLAPDQAEDPVIEIALGERLHPSKGFEFLLKRHGICRAITFFDQYPDPATREQSLALLSETLYHELAANLRAAIERTEGHAPDGARITDLIAGRDELFGEYSYHVDLSHLMSVVRLSADADDPGILARGLEMAEYGSRLHSTLSYRGDPPFEDFFRDSAIYLRARTGVAVEEAIAHFRAKVASYDYEEMSTYPAQVFVRMLLRLGRPQDAIQVFEQFLADTNPAYLSCPPLAQLCRMAGDYERLKQLARREGDLVQYSAALIAQNAASR
jgi:tetratricopeptide (TPR) repeat protein